MTRRQLISVSVLVLSLMSLGSSVRADPIHWRTPAVHIAVEAKDLKDVLRDFAAGQGVAATVADDVQGTVSGQFEMSPQRFLETLASAFGFIWFYDGSVLSISNVSAVTRQVIRLDAASVPDLMAALKQLHLHDERFPLMAAPQQGVVIAEGVPSYVKLVAEIAQGLDHTVGRHERATVRIFPLQYAWAADHEVQIGGKAVSIPGVATVLSNLYHQSSDIGKPVTRASGSGQSGVAYMSSMADVSGSHSGEGDTGASINPPIPFLPPGNSNPAGQTGRGGIDSLSSGLRSSASAPDPEVHRIGNSTDESESLPIIQADARTNSVIVRDLPRRLAEYEPLVGHFDVRPKLVEIEAHIIEIDDEALEQIGIDWRAHSSHVDFQNGTGTHQQNSYNGTIGPNFGTATLADGTTVVSTGPVGASLTAVLGSASTYLLARVDALQQTNRAHIDASPTVATLNNVEAVMDSKTQFFVPVSGYTSGNLYSVSAGVSLRVLPLVVSDGNRTQIKLDVHIEDGQITGQTVNNIPIVTNSTINTEAFIEQGQSLLIGGYRSDSATDMATGVPVLSKIPIIGALFRYHNTGRSRMKRIFLLTPRVLDMPPAA